MFKYMYILLIFAFFNAKAEEPNLVWQTALPEVQSMFILNDSTILMHADYLRKSAIPVTWFVNIETGEIIDSLFHGVSYIKSTKLSPNGKILALCSRTSNGDGVLLFDLTTKKIINKFESIGDITFKDDENIYVFYDYGIYLLNILTGEKELIFEKEVYHPKYGMRIEIGPFGSKFNSNGKYALVIYDKGYLVNLETKEEVGSVAGPNDTYVFNPKNPDELVVYGGEQMHFYNTNDPSEPYLAPYKKVYFDEHIIGNHYGAFSEDGKYFAIYYLGWIRIYDLETKELKNKVYLAGITFNLYNNFVFLNQSARQYKYDISSLRVNESNNPIMVFPNPNTGNLTFNFHLQKTGNYDVKIINSIGQEVLNQNLGYLLLGANSITKELLLPNGTYFITITNGIENYNSQFIINK